MTARLCLRHSKACSGTHTQARTHTHTHPPPPCAQGTLQDVNNILRHEEREEGRRDAGWEKRGREHHSNHKGMERRSNMMKRLSGRQGHMKSSSKQATHTLQVFLTIRFDGATQSTPTAEMEGGTAILGSRNWHSARPRRPSTCCQCRMGEERTWWQRRWHKNTCLLFSSFFPLVFPLLIAQTVFQKCKKLLKITKGKKKRKKNVLWK